MAELRKGGFKSVGEALGSYLNPENSEAGTFQRFAGNLVSNVRELTGTDDESVNRHHEGFKAAMALQRHKLGTETLTPEQLAQLEPLAKDWSINIASNVGAVAPISKAVRAENLAKFMEGSEVQTPVYHGTNSDFTIFDKQKLGKETFGNANDIAYAATSKVGHWFNDGSILDANNAPYNSYKKVHISPKNIVDYSSLDELAEELRPYVSKWEDPVWHDLNPKANFDDLIDEWKNDTFHETVDGIRVNDEEFGGKSYVMFDNKGIKSATGNRGTFDPNDPNIFHGLSVGAAMGSKNKEEKKSGTTVDNYLNQYYKHGN